MAKKVQHKDIIQDKLFEPTIKEAKELLTELDKMKKSFRSVLTETKDFFKQTKSVKSTKELKKYNEQVVKSRKASEGLNKVEKQAEKIREELNNTTADQIRELEKLKAERREQRKIQKDIAILQDREAGTLEKVAASNRQLRREREKLNLETEEGIKRTKEINKQINENNQIIEDSADQMKKQRLNVGNYSESVEEALGKTDAFTGILGELGGRLDDIKDVLVSAVSGVDNLRKSQEKTEETTRSLSSGFRRFGKIVKRSGILAIIAIVGSLAASIATSRENMRELEIKFQQFVGIALNVVTRVGNAFGGLLTILKGVGSGIQGVFNALTFDFDEASQSFERSKERFSKGASDIAKAFDGTGESITKANAAIRESLELRDRLTDQSRILRIEIAKLRGEEELLSARADDVTLSFNERQEAIREAVEFQQERIEKELELAELEKERAVASTKAELGKRGLLNDINEEQIRSLDILENQLVLDKANENVLEELAAAEQNLIEIQNEQALSEEELTRKSNELLQDRLERNLDFQIDLFDAQKTANEKIINDTEQTFERRKALLRETTELAEQAFGQQVETIAQFADKTIPIQELLAEKNIDRVISQVRALELSEIAEGRLLEVLRERIMVLSDLSEAEDALDRKRLDQVRNREKTINKIEQEQFRGLIDQVKENFEELGETRFNALREILNEEFELRKNRLIAQAEFELTREKLTAEERELIREKLNNDLAALERERVDAIDEVNDRELQKEKELANERIELARKVSNETVSAVEDGLNRRSKAEREEIERSIERRNRSVERQQELARQGLDNTLAYEEEQLAQAELRRRQQQEREENRELALAYIKAFQAALESDEPGNAALKAFAEVTLANTIADAIAGGGLYEGAEEVSDKHASFKLNRNKDNLLVPLHEGERVIGVEHSRKLAKYGLSNDELVNIVDGQLSGRSKSISIEGDFSKHTKEVTSALKKYRTETHYEWNSFNEMIEKRIENGMRKIIRHRNNKPL